MKALTLRLLPFTLAFAALAFLNGPVLGETIVGPSPPYAVGSEVNSGLEITALRDTTLISVTFVNQGAADTIELTNAALSAVYDSITTPGGNADDTATISWTLTAGTTYFARQRPPQLRDV